MTGGVPPIRQAVKCALSKDGLPRFFSTATHVEVPTIRQAFYPDEPLYELRLDSGFRSLCISRVHLSRRPLARLNTAPVRQPITRELDLGHAVTHVSLPSSSACRVELRTLGPSPRLAGDVPRPLLHRRVFLRHRQLSTSRSRESCSMSLGGSRQCGTGRRTPC